MPELIDKHAAYKALKHEAETHEFYESEVAYNRAARIIDQMPTILDIDRASILRLCNEIEDIVNEIAACAETIDYSMHKVITDKLKEIGKELTGDAKCNT